MEKGKVFFQPIDGTGSLTISWASSPQGDGIEANEGSGVGFFSQDGCLLAVIFDEFKELQDEQVLKFDQISVQVAVQARKVDYVVADKTK